MRGFHIKGEDMVQHGYTRSCPRCDCYRTGRVTGVSHTHECRERFRKLFEEKGDGRVGRARQRRGDLPDGPVVADAMEEEHGAHHVIYLSQLKPQQSQMPWNRNFLMRRRVRRSALSRLKSDRRRR